MGPGPSQQQQTSSTSNPWAPAQPMLQGILNQLGTMPLSPTSAQTSAGNQLVASAGNLPNFGGGATNTVNTLLGGGNAGAQAPMLSDAYSDLRTSLGGFTNPANLNPMMTPGLAPALSTMNQDITNQINGQFAAAGRSGSPGNTQALARGLSQGDAGLLLGQYNTNAGNLMGASQNLFGGADTTAQLLTGLNQQGLSNQLQGLGAAGQIPGLLMQPAEAQFGAATTQAQQPFQNLGWASSIADPIAALGGQSSGTSTTTSTQNPWTTAIGAGIGGLGLLGGMGGFGATGWLNPSSSNWISDVRMKEDVEPIGMLFDGLPIYRYHYKGDETRRPYIGLLAQDVEQVKPEAVTEIGGIKTVDYAKATDHSAMAA